MQKREFTVDMTKDEMLKFYANKIVEDGIRNSQSFHNIVSLTDYNNDNLKLEDYRYEILQLLYRDERIADVEINKELDVDMIFYTDFCPFYYDDQESITYNDITDSPTYQAIILTEFIDHMKNFTFEEGYASTRILINNFTDKRQIDEETKDKMANFLKKSIIQTGFVEKYIENITVYVTHKNNKELEKGLLKIVNQLDQTSKKAMESEEEFE